MRRQEPTRHSGDYRPESAEMLPPMSSDAFTCPSRPNQESVPHFACRDRGRAGAGILGGGWDGVGSRVGSRVGSLHLGAAAFHVERMKLDALESQSAPGCLTVWC